MTLHTQHEINHHTVHIEDPVSIDETFMITPRNSTEADDEHTEGHDEPVHSPGASQSRRHIRHRSFPSLRVNGPRSQPPPQRGQNTVHSTHNRHRHTYNDSRAPSPVPGIASMLVAPVLDPVGSSTSSSRNERSPPTIPSRPTSPGISAWYKCPMCLERSDYLRVLRCGHVFCSRCVK